MSNDSGYLWIYPQINSRWTNAIVDEFNIHPLLAQILTSRGFTELDKIHDYLYFSLRDLLDPYLLADMGKAVERVLKMLENDESILIYADNDVDGMTGAALLVGFLGELGANVHYYIPDSGSSRQDIIVNALEYAKKHECKLFVTVDCGITAADEVEHIINNNIDVIVTDHHEPIDSLPNCVATLNPKLIDSSYPNKELTGVGVAFKLAHAVTKELLKRKLIKRDKIDLKQYLDLVALGTISDMGELLDENRCLVSYGLRELRKGSRIGLKKLFQVCATNEADVNANVISTKVAPRLNSLGRIATPRKGVELLLIRDDAELAEEMALDFDLLNTKRQKIEREIQEDIDRRFKKDSSLLGDRAIVLASENWHPGVIASTTTRLSKNYNRPTVVISIKDGVGKGSIRSIKEFPLLQHLKSMSGILSTFGGHNFAAGVVLPEENIAEFKRRFISSANDALEEQDVISKLRIDANIDFRDLTFDFMDSLSLLEPYGNANPQPVFYCNVKQAWAPKVLSKRHLKLYLEQDGRMLEGIGFGMAERILMLKKKNITLRIAFTPQINNFQDKPSIQLLIRDFKIIG